MTTPESLHTLDLQGTWLLEAADALTASGERVRDYGQAPHGRLMVDAAGRYSVQIFKSERVRFSGDKAAGTPDEFRNAVMGSSTHYGTVTIDRERHALVFRIEGSSYPNWEGTTQTRTFRVEDGVLTWQVPPRPDGTTPISVWRREPSE